MRWNGYQLGWPRPLTSPVRTCNKDFGLGKENAIRVRSFCPCDKRPEDPSHIAAVVKDESGRLWLRIEACVLGYEKKLSPSRWLNSLKGRIGQYLTIRLIVSASL